MEIYSLKSVIVTDSPLAFDCYAQNLIEDCTNRNMCMSDNIIIQALRISNKISSFLQDTVLTLFTSTLFHKNILSTRLRLLFILGIFPVLVTLFPKLYSPNVEYYLRHNVARNALKDVFMSDAGLEIRNFRSLVCVYLTIYLTNSIYRGA